jgi:hypothetical protein
MASPVKFRDKWRIRWMDSGGVRRSAVFESSIHIAKPCRRCVRADRGCTLAYSTSMAPAASWNTRLHQ